MLKVQDTIQGCTVLKVKKSIEGQQIILVAGWNRTTPFVVWRYREEDQSCHSGDYCSDLGVALTAFNRRN